MRDTKNGLLSAVAPVFVDLPADQAAHVEPTAEIWYVTCRLEHGARRFGVQAMVTTSPSGRVFTTVSMTESSGGAYLSNTTRHDPSTVRLATDALDIDTGNVAFAGPMEAMTLRTSVDGMRADLLLTPKYPVIYSCGTGMFPYFHGPTHQYALPGLEVAGTITVDGSTIDVRGDGWYDRQWSASRDAFGMKRGFTWFGLWLDSGHGLSVWDVTNPGETGPVGAGRAWATVVAADGTHTVAAMTPLADLMSRTLSGAALDSPQPECWVVALPGIDTELEVRHERVHEEPRFYSGICTVTGRFDGRPVSGYGVVDTVPPPPAV